MLTQILNFHLPDNIHDPMIISGFLFKKALFKLFYFQHFYFLTWWPVVQSYLILDLLNLFLEDFQYRKVSESWRYPSLRRQIFQIRDRMNSSEKNLPIFDQWTIYYSLWSTCFSILIEASIGSTSNWNPLFMWKSNIFFKYEEKIISSLIPSLQNVTAGKLRVWNDRKSMKINCWTFLFQISDLNLQGSTYNCCKYWSLFPF